MKPLRHFNEYVNEGIVKKQSPDKLRANSLIEEAKDGYKVLLEYCNKIGISNKNANYIIKNAYDIIMELIRAKMLINGFSSSGLGAHEVEVSYLRELKFKESEIEFANQLRYFRNSITYYGKKFDAEYAKKVIDFLGNVFDKLRA